MQLSPVTFSYGGIICIATVSSGIQDLIWLFDFLYACSSDNAAEKLFAEMKDRDGSSYDAMIQGLVKVNLYPPYNRSVANTAGVSHMI